jgi:hypothetical protein
MGSSFAEVLSDTIARQGSERDRSPSPFAQSLHGWEACVAEAAIALLAPDAPMWARTLRVSPHAPEGDLRRAFRQRAFEAHPDRGGTVEAFLAVKKALDEGLAAIGERALSAPRGAATGGAYTRVPARRRSADVAITA